jgi:hypothetical protein
VSALPQYEDELAEIRAMLATDGFGLEVVGADGRALDLRLVHTSPDACADCIVPKPVMTRLVDAQLEPFDLQLRDLTYPAEPAPDDAAPAAG